jgi:hypothetical protein
LPAGQAAALAQLQRPVAEQVSARTGSHATQVPPEVPQVEVVGGRQAPPLQHPFGHDVALHTHAPLTHAVPAGQAAPLPQRQVPALASQLFVAGIGHALHAAPPMPQVVNAGVVQTSPAQQP